MKPLKKVYEDLNAFYASLDKLTKWMSSNRGKEFAKRLGREPLDQLIKRLGAPNIDKKDYIQKLNSYKYAVKQSGLQRRAIIVKDYDKKVKEMKEAGKLKLPPSLTKEDLMKMNTYIVRDRLGNAVIKTDEQGRQFWNKFTNKPILVRKRKSSKMGLAQKCHLYELYKMEKWDRKNPAPTDQGLSYDLFPKELLAAHRTKRELQVERVRNMLSERFYGAKNRVPLLRLFRVCQFKSQFLPGGFGVYETEATNNYDFTSYTDTYPSNEMIMKKLQYRIMHPDWSAIGTTVVGLKVYDQYGNVRGQLSFIDSLKPTYRSLLAAA
jgi:hypothetical protein